MRNETCQVEMDSGEKLDSDRVIDRVVVKGCSPKHLLWLSMLDFPFMLRVKLPVVDRILFVL